MALEPRLNSSPLWLSHHRSEQRERCMTIGPHQVCRRCVVLYPTVIVTAALASLTGLTGGPVSMLGVSVLMIPFLGEWIGEHSGRLTYSPLRQILVTLFAGVGGGAAFAVHLRSTFDPWVTGPVALCAATAGVAALLANRRRSDDESSETWNARFEVDEARRSERLKELLAEHAASTGQAVG